MRILSHFLGLEAVSAKRSYDFMFFVDLIQAISVK